MAGTGDTPAAKKDIARLDAKIDGVEKRLDAKIDGAERRLDAKIDGVEKRLGAQIRNLAGVVVKNQADIGEIKRTMATKDDIQRVLGAIDTFAGKIEDYARETVTFPNHEKRLSSLESSR